MSRKAASRGASQLTHSLTDRINREVGQLLAESGRARLNLMEVCGTHTMAISSFGIRQAVDPRLRLISGPGCPVCVTSQPDVDAATALADIEGVAVVTFGDMLRVPGTRGSLEQAKARGADVRVVYSPADVIDMAKSEPGLEFVFLGVGFETTAPTVAASVKLAAGAGVENLRVLAMFKLVPPALRHIASSDRVEIDGLILPGHVSTIIGSEPYRFLADEFNMPCCVTGFEATDILQGILILLEQLRTGPDVAIQYRRVVRAQGNQAALRVMSEVFVPAVAEWRGVGEIPGSGLALAAAYKRFDAREKFRIKPTRTPRTACRCGDVMLGVIVPPECPLFAGKCTPGYPVGPCMVSSEGACAAYYRYDRVHG